LISFSLLLWGINAGRWERNMENAHLLGLVNPTIAMLFGLTFFVLWSRQKHRYPILAFAISYVLSGVGFLISHLTPNWTGLLKVFVLDSIYLAGAVIMTWGVCTRASVNPQTTKLIAIAIVGISSILSVTALGFSYNVTLLVVNFAVGGIMLFCCWNIRKKAFLGSIESLVFWAIFIAGSQFWLRSGVTLTLETVQAGIAYRDSTYWAVLNASVAICSIVVALSLIAACATDVIKEIRTISETDLLTGLRDRRAFEETTQVTISNSDRADLPLSLVILDIDHFKQVNDTYGHQIGDKVIARLGRLIREIPRKGDVAGRLGGEEFAILLWNTDLAGARLFAEGLRSSFESLRLEGMPRKQGCTISLGVAQLLQNEEFDDLYGRADSALYEAKNRGRNRVECDDNHAPALYVVA
ncbi:MAG: GGDEF domain-containing protein, partial [Pseudomonadota bacterium]